MSVERVCCFKYRRTVARSDPRVSGTYSSLGATEDAHPSQVIAWSVPVRLDAQTGDRWTGTVSGTFHPEMGWQGTGWLASDEPGDMSVFFLHIESPERADGVWEIEGVIHDGYASSEDTSGKTVAETDVARIAAARGERDPPSSPIAPPRLPAVLTTDLREPVP